ncbi:hypothetical protein KR222_001575, partial [Zaprionus bogoriensis]
CNSHWIVIQQRIRGYENFRTDWATYRRGFGTFDGDFFLGLEKIHRLTRDQPQKLHIRMESFNGSSIWVAYDEFAISGEEDQYRLSKLHGFSGNTRDWLEYHKNSKFSTYDRDND